MKKFCAVLEEIQKSYYQQAKQFREANIRKEVLSLLSGNEGIFSPKNNEKPEIHGGFVLAKSVRRSRNRKEAVEELRVRIHCLPLNQSKTEGKCILTGRPATLDAIFAKSY